MKTAYRALPSLIILFMAAPVFAHEGHGNPQWVRSVLHYMLEPEHLYIILPTVFAALLILRWLRNMVLHSRASLTLRSSGAAQKRAAP